MGLDFTRQTAPVAVQEVQDIQNVQGIPGEQKIDNLPEVKEYDIVAERQQMSKELVNSEEVDKLVSTIELDNMNTIVSFGAEVANEISKASDTVLSGMNLAQLNETGDMFKALSKIMGNFDIKEIKQDPGFFGKLLGNVKKQIEKILAKYQTMGGEVDKIYVQLKTYEEEIKQSNQKLDIMFETNVDYYRELVKYILAGEQACKEIEAYKAQREKDLAETGDQSITFELNNLNNCLSMMEQRTQDLRIAENVALQSIPMIKTMEFSNYNLVRKINSAFIVTLPIFKQALAQAMLLKRQKLQAEAMAELDKKTNEMLVKNAQNTVDVAKNAAILASGSSIQIETLEKTWKTITTGLDEVSRLQEDASKKRIEDKQRLEAIKSDFKQKFNAPKA